MASLDSKILVVDDTKGIRFVVIKLLKELGYTNIIEAENGKMALEQITTSGSDIKLIIADIKMPEMDGLQLLQTMKALGKYNHLPIIVLSAESDKMTIVKAIDYGAKDYIIKPVEKSVLSEKLKKFMI